MFDLKHIGKICKEERTKKGYTQLQVAYELNYSSENISAFECGRNDNLRIFIWYLINCLDITIINDYFKEV